MDTDLTAFQRSGDGRFDEVHSLRNTYKADVAVLVERNRQYCGIAYFNPGATYAFGLVNASCASSTQAAAHEVGHIQGARHNMKNDPATSPYAYGHGYQNCNRGSGNYHTVMSYQCHYPYYGRGLNYFSTPNKTWNGLRIGTAAYEDNVRLLNETAGRVVAFR